MGGEAEGADFLGCVGEESGDEVGGVGVIGEFDVTRRGEIVGGGVGVVDAEKFAARGADGANDGENFSGVDFVGRAGSGGDVFGGVDVSDGGRKAGESGEEAANFSFGSGLGEEEDLLEDGAGDVDGIEHGRYLGEGRSYLKNP